MNGPLVHDALEFRPPGVAFKPRAGFTFTMSRLLSQLFKSILRKAFDAVEAVVKKLKNQFTFWRGWLLVDIHERFGMAS